MDRSAEGAGRNPATIRRVLNGAAAIGPGTTQAQIPGPFGMAPPNIAGTADQILETVKEYRNEGIDTIHLAFQPDKLIDQVQQFGEEVIAKVN